MKIGVFAILFNDRSLDETLGYLSGIGAEAVELGTGGYAASSHCVPEKLLGSRAALEEFRDKFRCRNLDISLLGCYGNPVHPDRELARRFQSDFEKTVLLAAELGVDRVGVLSGCPGGSPSDRTPNWVTCPWPEDYGKILDYQWNDVLIPYWQQAAAFAKEHGVRKLCMEMHPGFCVYNPETLLRLRDAVGKELGVNFDPSHLFWQGIDPAEAVMALGDAVYHVHAKDTLVSARNVLRNGVLDTKHYSRVRERAWTFRTVGYGHPAEVWKNLITALRITGYDHVLSVEHEDCTMAREEGLEKAVAFLREIVIRKQPEGMWWA